MKPSSNSHNHHIIHRYPVSINGSPRWIIVHWNGIQKEGIVDDGNSGKAGFNAT